VVLLENAIALCPAAIALMTVSDRIYRHQITEQHKKEGHLFV